MARFGLVCLVGTLTAASVAFGQVAPPTPRAESDALVSAILNDLGSDDVSLRLDAERRLIEAGTVSLHEIENVARGKKLSLEQRRRLTRAAYKRFCNEPRAGMGIQSGMDSPERGLLLTSIVRGFPAFDVLRIGDRLLSVDGHPMTDITTLRPVVVSRDPGDEVAVVVVRAGNTLNLRVRLGRFNDLNQRDRFSLTQDILDEGWALRRESYADPEGKAEAPPIESGLQNAAWQLLGTQDVSMDYNDGGDPNVDPQLRFDAARLRNVEPGETALVAAGEARGAGSQIRWSAQQGMSPNMRVLPPGNAAEAQAELQRQQRLQRDRTRVAMMLEIERLQTQLANADDPRKKQIEAQLAAMRQRLDALERMPANGRPMQP